MAELTGDAAALVAGQAGAAPTVVQPGSAAVPPGQPVPTEPTGAPPAGYAPISALRGEQANTATARQQAADYRAALELAGYQFDDTGAVYAPQPRAPQPTQGYGPRTVALAEQLGVDPGALAGVAEEVFIASAPGYMEPLARSGFEQHRARFQTDPDYGIWGPTFERELERRISTLPAHLQPLARVAPDVLGDAKAFARDKHFTEIAVKHAERAANPGRVVGTWTEGARPGQGDGAPPALSDAASSFASTQGITDAGILQKAAANKAAREGRR